MKVKDLVNEKGDLKTSLAETPGSSPPPAALPTGADLTKTPQEVQDVTKDVKTVLSEHGSDILRDAVNKLKPDMSFEDPKTINRVDITMLKPEQRVAYYLDLQQGSAVNKYLGAHYGDNLYAKNQDDLRVAAQPRNAGDLYPDQVVQKDIDGKIRKLEKMMDTKGDLAGVLNTNIGSWIKDNDSVTYDKINRTFDKALFGNGETDSGSARYKSQNIVDALSGLSTTTLLAQTFMEKGDYADKTDKVSTTFHDVLSDQLKKSEPGLRDTSRFAGSSTPGKPDVDPSTPPPADASNAEYKKWFDGLTEDSGSRRIQPIISESFNQSDIADKLKAAGYKEGSDTWNQYKDRFAKDSTLAYNNYWGNIRKNVKLDVIYSQVDPVTPRPFEKLPRGVAGVDADMFRAGVLHTVQNATLAAALGGAIIGANGNTSDPKTAMTITYATTNLADMLAETASKYLDPKYGGFKKLGLNKDGNWTNAITKYTGGDFKVIEAAGKLVAGAGSVVFGATALWKTIDAIKTHDAPAAIFNSLNAAGSTVAGLTLGAEGVLQWTGIAKNYAMTSLGYTAAEAASFDAAARGALATVGFVGGAIAGLGLTGLSIYDFAKQVKVLDRTMDDANKRYIAPTTGWKYEFLIGPHPDGSAAV